MEDRSLIIYGAGEYGKRMLHFLRSLEREPDYFCQTEVEEGAQVEGIPVVPFAFLVQRQEKMRILIAIGNKEVSRKIRLRLMSVLLDRAVVRECCSLLDGDCENNCSQEGHCLICNYSFENFIAGGFVEVDRIRLFREHHIIGGGWRKNFQCPVCGSIDRERWQLWVMSKHTGIFRERCRVLHFAPEKYLSEFIAVNPECEYYTGDIVPGRAMHQTDILDIQYKDATFDYVILNHVLEHIDDMGRALSEVKRVLKSGGNLILSFPICTDSDTLELPGILSKEERLEHYGQEDHVRLFGRDFQQRISSFGLDVTVYSPKDWLTQEEIMRYGLIYDDVLMVCRKHACEAMGEIS